MKDFSTIFNLMQSMYLEEWREELDSECLFSSSETEYRNKLLQTLGEENKELLDKYKFSIERRKMDVDLKIAEKILHLGMKIGFEMREAFTEID